MVPQAARPWPKFIPETILLAGYFISRLWYLTDLPAFVDEATHIRWALEMAEKGALLEIADEGKVLPVWIMSLVLPLFPETELLWGGRLVSVGFGLLGLVGCYLLGRQLFDRSTGLLAALFYLVAPYTIFHDRMVLVDGPMAVLAIYVALFSVLLIRTPGFMVSLGLGISLLLVSLIKFNGFTQGVLPILALAFYRPFLRGFPWRWLLLSYGIGLLGLLPLVVNFTTHWGPVWERMRLSRPDTAFGVTWWLNAQDTLYFLGQNLSWLICLWVFLGAGIALIRWQRDELFLLSAAGLTLIVFVVLSKPGRWYPRYLMPAVPFLLLLAARTLVRVADTLQSYLRQRPRSLYWAQLNWAALVIITILPALWFDYWLLIDPPRAPFVAIDRYQYVSGVHAGYGLRETSAYLRTQIPPSGQILFAAEEYPGALRSISQIYLFDQRERIVYTRFDLSDLNPEEMVVMLSQQTRPVYVLISESTDCDRVDLNRWPYLKPLTHFQRPGQLTSVCLYRAQQ